MKKVALTIILVAFSITIKSQIVDVTGLSLGNMTIGTGTGTLYQFAGAQSGTDTTNQHQGGFGVLSGSNVISPIIWMYGYGDRNAFQVIRKGYNSTVQSGKVLFQVSASGNVGIGTTNPDSKLTVAGNIHSREVKVTVNAGADFVFEDNYNLLSLEEVQQFIQENGHLPEIASAKEMEANGIHLAEMNIKLLQKIEELTLYAIEQEKMLKEQENKVQVLEEENKGLKEVSAKLLELESRLERMEFKSKN